MTIGLKMGLIFSESVMMLALPAAEAQLVEDGSDQLMLTLGSFSMSSNLPLSELAMKENTSPAESAGDMARECSRPSGARVVIMANLDCEMICE